MSPVFSLQGERGLKRCSFLRGSQRVEAWRLGERAPGELSSGVLLGEAFPLITGQTGSEGGGWRRRKNSLCFPKEKLCLERAGLESLTGLCVPAVEPPEREGSAVRPTGEGCPGGQREMLVAQRCLRDVSTCPTAQEGPRLVLANPLEGSAGPGLGSMKETALDSSRNSEFFLKTGLNRSCQRVQKGEAYPVAQFLLSLFDTGNGSRNSS